MTPERVAALIVGGLAICFGVMLLPYADALRRRFLKRREPPPSVDLFLDVHIPRQWRNHVLPWFFMFTGAMLVLFGVFSVPR